MKPGLGARLCPRCGTRVDERRGKFSPYCLSCGQPLNERPSAVTVPPYGPPAFAPAPSSSSALPWVIALLCFFCLLVGVGIAVFFLKGGPVGGEELAEVPTSAPAVPSVEKIEAPDAGKSFVAAKPVKPFAVPTSTPPRPTFTPTPAPTPIPRPTAIDDPPPPPRAFPRNLANAKVDQVMATLSTCKRSGDPTGSSVVGVTFENDGRVGTTMRRPFASTPTGDCISQRFLALQNSIGRFDGNAVIITRGFTIAP